MFGLRRHKRVPWPELTGDKIRQRAKVLVIDDEPFLYEALFKRDGYSVECWTDVQSLDRLTDDSFDLIFLDISGIGREYAKAEQGFGVLRHIKDRAPWKAVIAYSGKKWSLEHHDGLRSADLVLDKSLDYVDIRRHVDELLRYRFSREYFIERIAKLTGRSGVSQQAIMEVVREGIDRRDLEELKTGLQKKGLNSEATALILQVAELAVSTASMFVTS